MKKLSLVLVAILFAVTGILAQTPNQFKYQAVLRNADGTIMANEAVTVDISILQGSASGTSVFTEQHSVTTTAQGLINLNIGSVEDLSVVDWSSATYFIEISVNSTVMGTSQLLSVPYAMHASTVENDNVDDADADATNELQDLTLNGTTLEISDGTSADLSSLQDGTGTDDQNLTGATLTGTSLEIAIEDGSSATVDLSSLQDGVGDGSETSVTAGTNVTVTGTGTTANPYIVNATAGGSTYYVGQLIGTEGVDGVVFYVDETGEHGLICSQVDIDDGSGVVWSNIDNVEIGETAKNEFNGTTNTSAITEQSGHTSSAAKLCVDYSTTGTSAGDWYLPSIDELSLIYHAKYQINKALNLNSFALTYYWSSTESDYSYAWVYTFGYGYSDGGLKFSTYRVRAVRAF